MASLKDNYYLINGDQYESYALFIPYNGEYYRSLKDISDMDKATIALGTDYKQAVQECNPNLRLGTSFYVAKSPVKNGPKIYKPIEIFKRTDKVDELINKFMQYVELRNYNYHHGLSLELSDKDKVVSLAHEIYSSLKKHYGNTELLSEDSIIGKDIKDSFLHNSYLFKRQIDYTQLRNFIINYLYIVADKSIPSAYQLHQMYEFSNYINGLYKLEPGEIKEALEEYKQLVLKAKNDEDRRKAIEEFNQMTREKYVRMNLFDMYPELIKK